MRRESLDTNTLVNVNRQQGSARSGDLSLGHIGPVKHQKPWLYRGYTVSPGAISSMETMRRMAELAGNLTS
ncbi:hypothetical protein [Rhizobium sp. 18055]|uniref:hypothetical protein n=1 Tax=Rhizobium sp. 18055 TaxID=2681403 RepID=UPI00135AB77D|nr:hypothetical protein [Rhizobium sp. 18055]